MDLSNIISSQSFLQSQQCQGKGFVIFQCSGRYHEWCKGVQGSGHTFSNLPRLVFHPPKDSHLWSSGSQNGGGLRRRRRSFLLGLFHGHENYSKRYHQLFPLQYPLPSPALVSGSLITPLLKLEIFCEKTSICMTYPNLIKKAPIIIQVMTCYFNSVLVAHLV